MGAVMVYGSYLSADVSIAKTSVIIAAIDTIVALLAGLIIFPIVFTHGLHPDSGPGLIFKTLPIAFGTMTGGWLFGILFFLVLTIAALTSSIALIEPAVAWLVDSKAMPAKKRVSHRDWSPGYWDWGRCFRLMCGPMSSYLIAPFLNCWII